MELDGLLVARAETRLDPILPVVVSSVREPPDAQLPLLELVDAHGIPTTARGRGAPLDPGCLHRRVHPDPPPPPGERREACHDRPAASRLPVRPDLAARHPTATESVIGNTRLVWVPTAIHQRPQHGVHSGLVALSLRF